MNDQNSLSLSRIKRWLSSPDAVNSPLVLFVLLWPFATGFLAGETPGHQFAFSIHLFDLLSSTISAGSLLLAARVFKLRFAAMLFASVTGTVLPLIIVNSFSFVPQAYVESIPFGILIQVTNMLGFLIFWNARNDLRTSVRELALARKTLTYLKANLNSELAANQSALNNQVMNVLESALAHLRAEMSSAANNAALASSLRKAIDNVIRPLSHKLASVEDAEAETAQFNLRRFEKEILKLPLRERLAQRVSMGEIANMPLTALAHLAFVLPASTFLYGPDGTIAALATTIALGFTNWLTVRALKSCAKKYWQVLIASASLGVVAFFAWLGIASLVITSGDNAMNIAVGAILFLSNFVLGYVNCQLAIQKIRLRQASETNDELQATVAQLRQDVWINRRRLAKMIHGSVQAKLQSSAILLIRGNNSELRPELLADEIAQSVSEVFSNTTIQPTLAAGVRSLQEFWAGVCELTVVLDDELFARIEANSQTAQCAYELISEATSNAVKHASADEIEVQMSARKDSLKVEIRNFVGNQNPPELQVIKGYGSRIYDEITTSWSLTFDDTDAILTATLPLAQ